MKPGSDEGIGLLFLNTEFFLENTEARRHRVLLSEKKEERVKMWITDLQN